MRDGWAETTLGLLVSLRTGKLDVNAGVEDGEFPFFTCSRDTYKIDVAAYSGKSVIVAGNGDLNVKYYEGEFNAYQRTYILQAIDESALNPIFLFHSMDKYLETLRNDTQGSTIQYLKKAQFTEAPILVPPLVEQKRIVDVVSSVDAYIDALQQQADSARAARQAIEVAEFDNPENDLSVLGDYCDKSDIQVGPFGSQLHQHEYVADGIPVVMPKNIVDGRISEKNIARITTEKASELKRHILTPGDVLFARRGDLSKRALVTEAHAGWLCGTGTVRVRSKKLDGAILFRLTNTSDVNTWLMDNSVGATMPNLNTAIVASIPLRVPGNALEAVALLKGMDDYLDGLTNSIKSALELRSGLLSDLLSGEHEIPDTYDKFLKVA